MPLCLLSILGSYVIAARDVLAMSLGLIADPLSSYYRTSYDCGARTSMFEVGPNFKLEALHSWLTHFTTYQSKLTLFYHLVGSIEKDAEVTFRPQSDGGWHAGAGICGEPGQG